jgi:hypothetical protein
MTTNRKGVSRCLRIDSIAAAGGTVAAVAMLARAIFELAEDIKLINAIPDSVKKMLTFTDVEKLRSAKRIVSFKNANPSAQVDATIYDQYIVNNGARIDAERAALWPGVKTARWEENNMRYFRFLSTVWRCSRVAGLRTMAERRRRDGPMKKVHRPAIMRSAGRRLGARLRPRLRIRS